MYLNRKEAIAKVSIYNITEQSRSGKITINGKSVNDYMQNNPNCDYLNLIHYYKYYIEI